MISGALTMALLILRDHHHCQTQEAITKPYPTSLQTGNAFALGATRWQGVAPRSCHSGGDAGDPDGGSILSISRAMGETAPLLVVGAAGLCDLQPNRVDRRPRAADADL